MMAGSGDIAAGFGDVTSEGSFGTLKALAMMLAARRRSVAFQLPLSLGASTRAATSGKVKASMSTATQSLDKLDAASSKVFNEEAMAKYCGADVAATFKEAVLTGKDLSPEAKTKIAGGAFEWARKNGATSFAHWFFPRRMGGGAIGGTMGALKEDTFVDLDWSSDATIKPFKQAFPVERLFCGETDGSSFPNGGLRATHSAAAFTSWDRSSPMFILDDVLRVPCCFVTHYGKCIDYKTPLLRASDAASREGIRLIKNMNLAGAKATNAKAALSYVGWEQEFFIVSAESFKERPDLVNCGRTLFGNLPTRNQQTDQQYFGPMPESVKDLLGAVEAKMLEIGVPMAVKHNEVAPGQHEMSPIFSIASASCDSNIIFMEICTREAAKRGLVVLFHEKPFKGINGNGKHNNWSVCTDSGINFFYPGKDDDERLAFVAGMAALAYGLKNYNSLVRLSSAHAGNDHRLGAQEAPPAIIAMNPGTGFEAHVDSIINGGGLLDYKPNKQKASPGASSAEAIDTNVEDRDRTSPFPFCGNRFEFRAVGSSQNCALPTAICSTIWAAGAAALSEKIEAGTSLRDAVAEMFKENRDVIFTGNSYGADWPEEAKKRGLPNLYTTPLAIDAFTEPQNKQALASMNVLSEDESDAVAETMYENYIATLDIEVETMLQMVHTGFMPAFARDLSIYRDAPELAGGRKKLYASVETEAEKLKNIRAAAPQGLKEEAAYIANEVKPQMEALRQAVDDAELLIDKSLYPYPTYENLLYAHHF